MDQKHLFKHAVLPRLLNGNQAAKLSHKMALYAFKRESLKAKPFYG